MKIARKVTYRDNIACVNPNFLKTNFNIKRSKCDDFRTDVIDCIESDEFKNLVFRYCRTKNPNVLINYINEKNIQNIEYFSQAGTCRLIMEYIIQETEEFNTFNINMLENVKMYLARILYYHMNIISNKYKM